MQRGIVMEVRPEHWVVMTPDGQFLKVPTEGREASLGDEIRFSLERKPHSLPAWFGKTAWMAGGLAAAMLLFTLLIPQWGPGKAHADSYVYIDLNPSLELGLDENRDVVEIEALNPAAKRLVNGLDWKGADVKDVVVDVLKRAQNARYLDHEERVLISEVVSDEKQTSTETLAMIEREVDRNPELNRTRLDLYTLPLPDELRVKAEQQGISPAKYAVGLLARRHGEELSVTELSRMSITDLMEKVDLSPVLRNPPSDEEWTTWIEEEDGKDDSAAEESSGESGGSGSAEDRPPAGSDDGNGRNGTSGTGSGSGAAADPEPDAPATDPQPSADPAPAPPPSGEDKKEDPPEQPDDGTTGGTGDSTPPDGGSAPESKPADSGSEEQ